MLTPAAAMTQTYINNVHLSTQAATVLYSFQFEVWLDGGFVRVFFGWLVFVFVCFVGFFGFFFFNNVLYQIGKYIVLYSKQRNKHCFMASHSLSLCIYLSIYITTVISCKILKDCVITNIL